VLSGYQAGAKGTIAISEERGKKRQKIAQRINASDSESVSKENSSIYRLRDTKVDFMCPTET
jgi:hypothetical protein